MQRPLRAGRVIVVLMVVLAACSEVAPPHGVLSDEQLQSYGTSRYNKRDRMHSTLALGTHRGMRVVAEFPCSDVCPDYTVRVIRYVVPDGKKCSDVGGVEREFKVPRGIAAHLEKFCFPEPLVAVWSRYVRASGLSARPLDLW